MKQFLKGPGFIIVLVVAILAIALFASSNTSNKPEELTYNQLLEKIESGDISKLAMINNTVVVYGVYKDSKYEKAFPDKYDFESSVPSTDTFYDDVKVIVSEKTGKSIDKVTSADFSFTLVPQQPKTTAWWVSLLPTFILIILMIVITFVVFKRSGGDGNKTLNFGRSRAERYDDSQKKVTFADIAGAEEEKQELVEIVEFLKNKQKFEALGARIPKGVLLVGQPGTGKTYIAKAVAGEAGVPFLSTSGSDFVEMFVGVGASRVRDLFGQAKRLLPCIIFIDEIDAVGRQRGTGLGGSHDEREQTLNQLLVEMDGFSVNSGLIVIAATNRADILDPALTRPGRFDRTIYVSTPDVSAREKIFKIHSKNKPIDSSIDLAVLAKMTPGFTPADIENIMNEAAILAARSGKKSISMTEITEAIKRVEIGPEKKSHRVTEKDKKLTAYHEAGHAIVAQFCENADPVNEISIVPRGQAGGYTLQLPEEDKDYSSKSQLIDRIKVCLGGRIAETIIFSDYGTGAYSDIVHATKTARAMVTKFGMSDVLGPINYSDEDHEIFIGRSLGTTKPFSESTAALIDEEVKKIVKECYAEAEKILTDNIDKLNEVANILLEKEKISGEEFKNLFKAKEEPAVGADGITTEEDKLF